MRVLLTLLLAARLCAAAEMAIEVDPAKSSVQFTLGDVLHTVQGTFKVKRGSLRFSPETGKASGEIVVDVRSGNSGGGPRDRRMHKDILESGKFPDAVLKVDRVTGPLTEAEVHGTLQIHGKDHEVTLPAKVTVTDQSISATATFSMPYVKWGMKNPSTFILRVSETVNLNMTLVGTIKPLD